MNHSWTLTKFRMLLALRNRAFFFFSVVIPLIALFLFAKVYAPRGGAKVAYVLASVLALTVMGSFWGLSMQLVIFREQGILRRFRLAPIDAGEMLLSSIVSNYILTLPAIVVEIVLARWLLHMDRWGNLLSIFALVLIGSETFAALGLVVASVTNSTQETQVINNLIWTGFLLLSGATVPLPKLPGWVQHFSLFLPATYLVTGLQRALLAGTPVTHLAAEISSLGGCTLLAFFVSRQIFRWEPEEKLPRRAKAWAAAALVPFVLLGIWESSLGQRRAEARSILESIDDRPPSGTTQPPR